MVYLNTKLFKTFGLVSFICAFLIVEQVVSQTNSGCTTAYFATCPSTSPNCCRVSAFNQDQCYSPTQHTCFTVNGNQRVLCPSNNQICGTTCYNPNDHCCTQTNNLAPLGDPSCPTLPIDDIPDIAPCYTTTDFSNPIGIRYIAIQTGEMTSLEEINGGAHSQVAYKLTGKTMFQSCFGIPRVGLNFGSIITGFGGTNQNTEGSQIALRSIAIGCSVLDIECATAEVTSEPNTWNCRSSSGNFVLQKEIDPSSNSLCSQFSGQQAIP